MAKNHRKRNIGIGVVVLAVLYVLFINPTVFEDTGIPTPQIVSQDPIDDTGTFMGWEGPVNIRFPSSDALDPSISYGEDMELDIIVYRLNSDGTYNRLTVPTNVEVGVATVTASPNLKTVYAEFSIASGQDYYVNPLSVAELNDRDVGPPQFLDLNNDGRPTYVFPITIAGFPENSATTPQFDFTVELIDEATFTLDSPTDVDITDTGKQRCNIKWSFDSPTSGDGTAVVRLRATFNSTAIQWFPLDSNVSFPTGSDPSSAKTKYFLQPGFVPQELASTFRYEKLFGSGDIIDAMLLLSPLNGETEFEVPFELWVNMDAVTSGLELTFEIQTIDVFGNTAESNDPVVCN